MNRDEKRVMGMITSSHALVHLFEGVLPPLIPLLIGVFQTDYFHLGLVVTLFSYTFGLGSLPAGFLADRFGSRPLLSFFLFGSGVTAVWISVSGSLLSYAVLMALVGFFCSTSHPAANTLISHAIREKGKAFGINGIAGSLGVAVAPALSAWLGTAAGWRSPHVLFGLGAIFVGVYSVTLKRIPGAPSTRPVPRGTDAAAPGIPYLKLFLFYASATILGLTYKGIMTFLPAYMGENVRLSFLDLNTVSLGGTVATLALLSGALGQYVAGRLIDRYAPEKVYLASVWMGTFFVFAMAFSSSLALIASSVCYAFLYFSIQPTQNYLISRYLPAHRQGLGFGLHFSLTFGVGSTSAAFSGYLADHFGLHSVFYAMGICFALASLLLFFLVRTSEKPAPPR
ncbi:MAG: MFS transporter [Thermodesulfobacteriota bacterium]